MTELDVRGLPPPEPFEQIMQALQTLANGASLRVLIHREPYPLYDVLQNNGFTWQTSALADGNFSILIGHACFPLLNPDETTSHSTKLANNASKVAGYLPLAGEETNVSLREFRDT